MLSLIDRLAKNKQEQYSKFWNEFGNVLKEGLVDDLVIRIKLRNYFALQVQNLILANKMFHLMIM